jgi:hypothetical protein
MKVTERERERLKVNEKVQFWFIRLGLWLAVLPILYLENTRLVFKLVFRKHKSKLAMNQSKSKEGRN